MKDIEYSPFVDDFGIFIRSKNVETIEFKPVLALTVKIRKSQDFLAPVSESPGDQMFSLTFRNSTSIFLNSHLWSKTPILKLNNT